MASVVNSNIPSLTAQRNLAGTSNTLNTALGRLSSGLRINSAKDDAAGLAISTRFSAQVRGLNQAARNANDAISLTQTAEGALQTITDNLQRIRELAVQSVNASNSSTDRAALDLESDALIAEIDRVATTTQFNGVSLLDGTFSSQAFQVGANASQTVSVTSISSARSASLGVGSGSSYSTTSTGAAVNTTALTSGQLSINSTIVGASSSDGVSYLNSDASAIAKAAAVNAITGTTNVVATVVATTLAGTTVTLAAATTALTASSVVINGVDIGAIAANGTAVERGAAVTAAVNAKTSQTGVSATFSTSTGAVALTTADGRNITIATSALATAAATGITVSAASTTNTILSSITLTSTNSAGITIADISGTAAAKSGLTVGYTAATATAGAGVSSLDLTTATGASAAITTIDAALATINTSRASLGALQSRFASTVTTLMSTSENLSAARSRILDADFAAETSSLTRAQILQQAGTAMLAQANALPNNVLTLLRG